MVYDAVNIASNREIKKKHVANMSTELELGELGHMKGKVTILQILYK